MPLQDIETIVFVMQENRSFDHLLGYLSMGEGFARLPVEGLPGDAEALQNLANAHGGQLFPPHPLSPGALTLADPPHDHASIAIQIGTPRPADPAGLMGGFVDSYAKRQPPPPDPSAVMGHYDGAAVPVYDFLARHFAVCDHWFAAVPCGTQPNRLMAMGGHSEILDNAAIFLPKQPLVYDWLAEHGISWAAYQSGDFLPFFALMAHWLPEITTSLALSDLGGRGRFRRYATFQEQWMGADPMPQVIFIEPEYTDGPHDVPNDDHPPTGVTRGQDFVADIYRTLTANPSRWRNTVMVVTYDEHGGFFDHVPPLLIPANLGGNAIATTGVRVPAFVVSPHVEPGRPFTDPLDHTSFLQLLADRFNPGQAYSAEVGARQAHLGRLSGVLSRLPPEGDLAPVLPSALVASLGAAVAAAPRSMAAPDSAGALATQQAFHNATMKLASDHPELLASPGLAGLAGYVARSSGAADPGAAGSGAGAAPTGGGKA